MEIESIGGIPAHPLIVHGAVVAVPLAVTAMVVVACWPAARRRFGWLAIAIAAVAAVLALAAEASGEELYDDADRTAVLREHADLGSQVPMLAFGVLFLTVAIVAIPRLVTRSRPGGATAGAARVGLAAGAVAALALGGLTMARVIETGHTGAESVWGDESDERDGGDEGDHDDDKDEDDD